MLEKLQVLLKWNDCESIACSMNAIFYCGILDKLYYNFVLSLNIIEHNAFAIDMLLLTFSAILQRLL